MKKAIKKASKLSVRDLKVTSMEARETPNIGKWGGSTDYEPHNTDTTNTLNCPGGDCETSATITLTAGCAGTLLGC